MEAWKWQAMDMAWRLARLMMLARVRMTIPGSRAQYCAVVAAIRRRSIMAKTRRNNWGGDANEWVRSEPGLDLIIDRPRGVATLVGGRPEQLAGCKAGRG